MCITCLIFTMNGVKRKKGFTVCGCVGPGREIQSERRKEKEGDGCVRGLGGGR